MHVLITYVGYNLEATWIAYRDIAKEVGFVDKVCIFCSNYKKDENSQASNELAHEVAQRIYLAEVPGGKSEAKRHRNLEDRYNNYGDKVTVIYLDEKENMDYDFIHEMLVKVYTDNGKPRVTMNITNGNSKTKCAMAIAASEIGASIYYVDNPKGGEQKLEKVTDCKALDYDTLGLTEKKVLWAIKELEEMHRLDNDKIHHAPKANSVDISGGRADREFEDESDITKARISEHTKANWPKGMSAQSLTAPVDSLVRRGYIITREINKKSVSIRLTSTGRIAVSKMNSRPVGKNDN